MRTAIRLSLVAILATPSLTLMAPTASALGVDCQFQKAKKLVTITIDNQSVGRFTIERAEGTSKIGTRQDAGSWQGCEQARTTDVNKIKVVGSTLSDQVVISVANGAFAPGAADERSGASEIEFMLDLGAGTDELRLEGGSGDDRLGFPKPGQASLNGDDDADVTLTNVDERVMFGGPGSDALDARGAPAVTIYGEEGSDRVVGGPGRDYLVGDMCCGGPNEGGDTILGGGGDDNLYGGGKNDVLNGGEDDDYLGSDKGDDLLLGGPGDDGVDSDSVDGADEYRPGPGDDYLDYDDRSDRVTVSQDSKPNDGANNEKDNVYPGLERIDGGAGNDLLVGTDGYNQIDGNSGNDTVKGLGGDDDLYGDLGNDTVTGGDGDEYFTNDAGQDKFLGGDGDDRFVAGSSNDGRDVYSGGPGYDSISYGSRTGSLSIDVLTDEVGDRDGEAGEGDKVTADFEEITGGSGSDTISGGPLSEDINGGGGTAADFLYGRVGADELYGNDGNDRLEGGEGYDRLYAGSGIDLLHTQDNGGNDASYCNGTDDTVLASDPVDYFQGCIP